MAVFISCQKTKLLMLSEQNGYLQKDIGSFDFQITKLSLPLKM